MIAKNVPELNGELRKNALRVPDVIKQCSGMRVFGKLIKSLVFSTDLSIIKNVNSDAIIAVYPFTPQPIITEALLLACDVPLFVGIGGGLTRGKRVVNLAMYAEMQGATGVVINSPTKNQSIKKVSSVIDIPIVVTVVSETEDTDARIEAGASIFNISGANRTPYIVDKIRRKHPDFPIIATGGPTNASIIDTINAGANAITWTPPSSAEIFKAKMASYREDSELR